jgi:DNA-binding MarR family transcriptional regulator
MLRYCQGMTDTDPRYAHIDALVANVFEAAGALRRHGDKQAAVVGQTQARWQVLSVLSQEPRSVPAAARRLGVSRQAVQRIVDVLREEGLIRTRANPAHATSPLLFLTPRGRRALVALANANAAWNQGAASELDPSDVQVTAAVLRQLVELCEAD